jgi:hypothetical protein
MSAPTFSEPANAAAFAGLLAHMRVATSAGRRLKARSERDINLARQAIALSKMGEKALHFSKEEAEKPGTDLEALYASVANAKEALVRFISIISRHPRLCMLQPLFEDALDDWDELAERLSMVATPERRALLDDLEQEVQANKDKFTDWRDFDLFQ